MSRKPFAVPDHNLWEEVTPTVKPIKNAALIKVKQANLTSVAFNKFQEPKIFVTLPLNHSNQHPPALSTFDRRTTQKLGRGQSEPESRIDLHGSNLENARHLLHQFLTMRRMRGERLVLVITGKGASPFAGHTLHGHSHFHTPEREGKLRREVPLWLEEAQFRMHVIGFQPAHPRHGGGGAFYIRLRKTDNYLL